MILAERNYGTGVITEQWVDKLDYVDAVSMSSIVNKAVLNTETDEIYTVGVIDGNILFLFATNKDTGAVIESVFVIDYSLGTETIRSFEIAISSDVYILADISTMPTLHTFDPLTHTVGISFSSSTTTLNLHALTFVGDMLVVGGFAPALTCGVFK